MNCRPEDMLVYAVTDRAWLKGESLKDQVEKALKGGVTFVQLREKNLDRRLFLEEAAAIKELCDSFHVPFVINDDVEIALASGADGVHVGQKDMDVKEARRRLGPGKIIGVSWSRQRRRRPEGPIIWAWEPCIPQIPNRIPPR